MGLRTLPTKLLVVVRHQMIISLISEHVFKKSIFFDDKNRPFFHYLGLCVKCCIYTTAKLETLQICRNKRKRHIDIMSSILSPGDPHNKYELVELLGEGYKNLCYTIVKFILSIFRSYGAVYKSINKINNDEVAIKILPAEDDMAKLEFEIEFLRRMRSPYVVSFIEGYNFEGELWVSLREFTAPYDHRDYLQDNNNVY